MDITKYLKEFEEIAKLRVQLNQAYPQDLRNLRHQLKLIEPIQHSDELKKLNNKIRLITDNMNTQLEREKELYQKLEKIYRPIIDAFASEKIRELEIRVQIKKIVEFKIELFGWYEPHGQIWETLSQKLELINPNYGFSYELIEQTNKPNIIIQNYEFPITEKDKHSFPIEVTKDVIGLPELIKDITHEDSISFLYFLSNYPMLGMQNEVGKKLFDILANMDQHELKPIELFKGRIWEDKQEIPFVEDQMFQPPSEVSQQKRFNPHGLQTLYFSESKQGVKAELGINDKNLKKNTIIKVTNTRPFKVIDLSTNSSPIIALCNKPSNSDSILKIEYLVPNFISQCCKYHEIDGIVYPSTHIPTEKNYAFFNIYKDSFRIIDRFNEF